VTSSSDATGEGGPAPVDLESIVPAVSVAAEQPEVLKSEQEPRV
jgi:hypothetical protein